MRSPRDPTVPANREKSQLGPLSPRTLKIVAIGYAVKTLLVGLARVAVPDLPERGVTKLRGAWQWAAGPGR